MGAIAVAGCIAGVGGTEGQPMLINNFSVSIFGMIIAIIGYFIIGPVMTAILTELTGSSIMYMQEEKPADDVAWILEQLS